MLHLHQLNHQYGSQVVSRAFATGRKIHSRSGNILSECNLNDLEKYSFLFHAMYNLRFSPMFPPPQ